MNRKRTTEDWFDRYKDVIPYLTDRKLSLRAIYNRFNANGASFSYATLKRLNVRFGNKVRNKNNR